MACRVFNTTCLIGPERHPVQVPEGESLDSLRSALQPARSSRLRRAVVSRRRDSDRPHRLAICYDWLFPEAIRQLAVNGAELLLRVSAYMDPWGATEPMDWWTLINRVRALENIAYVVAANQGASRGTIRPSHGRAGSRLWTSTAGFSRRRRRDPANGSLSRRSTSQRSVTNGRPGSATTCWRTSGPRPIPCMGDVAVRRESITTWRCRTKRTSGGSRRRSKI